MGYRLFNSSASTREARGQAHSPKVKNNGITTINVRIAYPVLLPLNPQQYYISKIYK